MNSSGSAMAENAKWMDSIAGKTEQLTNAMQAMWNDTLKSDVIKFFLDLALSAIKTVDAIGLLPTALAAAAVYFTAIKKNNPVTLFKDLSANIQAYSQAVAKVQSVQSLGIGGILQNTGAFDETRVNAYAAAVSNLTVKQQASILASQGLSSAHIQQILHANGATAADIKLAMAETQVAAAKQKVTTVTGEQLWDVAAVTNAQISEAAQVYLVDHAYEELTKEKLKNALASGELKQETYEEIMSLFTLSGAATGAGTAFKGLGAAIGAAFKSNPVGMILTIVTSVISLVSWIGTWAQSNEELIQQAEQIKNAYKQEADVIKGNISTLKGLESEFAKLSKGVDDYGNNISLATDDYERYKEIVAIITDMSPSLIQGYDAEGNAIANKNGLLEQSIQLMQEEQRLKAKEFLNDENITKVANGVQAQIEEYQKSLNNLPYGDTKYNFMQAFQGAVADNVEDQYDLFKQLNPANVDLEEYPNFYFKDADSFAQDYYEQIIADLRSEESVLREYFTEEQVNNMLDYAHQYDQKMQAYNNKIKSINSELYSTLKTAPLGETAYYTLTSEMQGYLSKYIDGLDVTYDNLDEKITEIQDLTNFIASNPDVQTLLTTGFKLNVGKDSKNNILNITEYKKQVEQFKKEIQTSSHTDDQKNTLLSMFGLADDDAMENDVEEAIQHVENILKGKADTLSKEAQDYLDNLTITEALHIKANISADTSGLSVDELQKKVNETYNFSITDYTDAISSHSAVISEYQEAIQKLDKGSFTMDDFMALIKKYPDLAKGVDISSNAFYGLSKNLNRAAKSKTKSFIKDLKELRDRLDAAGKSTASIDQLITAIENMPTDALDDTIERYGTLTDKIDEARVAQNRLLASMEENPNEGYETRGEALDYIKDKMNRGEIGSESEIWSIAEEYGFTYDSAKSINENADALAKWAAAREDWFKTDDDGNYTFEGTENFIKDVAAEVAANKDLQKILTWDYNEETGVFNFDFNNEDWDDIIKYLSESERLIDLTSAEWADMLVQVGQYFAMNWTNADDVYAYFKTISNGSYDAATKLDLITSSTEAYVEKVLGKDIDFEALTEDQLLKICDGNREIHELLKAYLELKSTLEHADIFGEDPLGISAANYSISTLASTLDTLGVQYQIVQNELGEPIGMDIQLQDLATALSEQGWSAADIEAYLNSMFNSENGAKITVDGEVNVTTEEIDAAIAKSKEIPEEKKTEYEVTGIGITTLESIDKLWTEITKAKSTTYTIYENTVKKTTEQQGSSVASVGALGLNKAIYPRVDGTAHAQGTAFADGSWGVPKSETALVGELGPELLVRNGHWTTVGENGAEFTQVKRGDIIFNHKQTEQLLENGYVTSRGKAYASGTAYASGGGTFSRYEFSGNGGYVEYDVNGNVVDRFGNSAAAIADALDDAADSVGEFEETLDWIEIRMEEFDERIGKLSAELENLTTYAQKNSKINQIITENQKKYADSLAGAKYYEQYAEKFLAGMNDDLVAAAKNGAIAITEFTKEQDEATVNAIQNYREYAQKAADLHQQAEEILTEIRDLAIQKIDNIQEYGSAKTAIEDAQTEKLQTRVDYYDTKGEIPSWVYYGTNGGNADNSTGMFENSYKKIDYWTPLLKDIQAELDRAVQEGDIKVGTIEWYEQLEKLYQVQAEIDAATIEIEEFQNSINDLYWDNFDELINRLDYLQSETQGLIDLMNGDDMVAEPEKRKYENGTVEYWTADDVEWTDEGLASLGLYAQQMEIAEYKAKQYAEAIDDLTKDYEDGKYSENEYYEKLNELTEAQYDSIEAYYEAESAIKDLNETRIDSIKNGIEKEIEAYEELINKKKEALDSEKDLYDFQKSTMEQSKNIADIERKLAALANDNSLSATAKRKQLEAELAEAQYELQDTYYNRSIEDKQSALDEELEKFQTEKDAEIVKWEEYLNNVELVVADSLNLIQTNALGIYDTLTGKAEEYNLTLSDYVMSPWQDGALAVSDYQSTFDTAMSSTTDQLEALKNKWQEVIDKMTQAAHVDLDNINTENAKYAGAREKTPEPPANNNQNNNQQQSQEKAITVGGKIDASGAKIYSYAGGSGYNQYYSNDPVYTVLAENGDWIQVRHHKLSSGVTGWFKKGTVKAYAKGTTGLKKDQWSLFDELDLEELVMHAGPNGKLQYMSKGTSIVPHDISENLMELGQLDPSEVLNRNRPQITPSKSVVNNNTEIQIDASVGTLLHVEHLDGNNPDEVIKIVDKAWDKKMQGLNNSIRKFTR